MDARIGTACPNARYRTLGYGGQGVFDCLLDCGDAYGLSLKTIIVGSIIGQTSHKTGQCLLLLDFGEQFKQDHHRAITFAWPQLVAAGVATRTLGIAGSQFVKDFVHHGLVIA